MYLTAQEQTARHGHEPEAGRRRAVQRVRAVRAVCGFACGGQRYSPRELHRARVHYLHHGMVRRFEKVCSSQRAGGRRRQNRREGK